MEKQTIKLAYKQYMDFSDIFAKHDVIILTGARRIGKSYPVAKYISKLLLEDATAQFIYMRCQQEELATVMSWTNDIDLLSLCPEAVSYIIQRGKPSRGDLTVKFYDDVGLEIKSRTIGKCISLEKSAHFKSGVYDYIKCIVFEEYTHFKMSKNAEEEYARNFLENVTTFFSYRNKKIFLISNSIKVLPVLERAISGLTGPDEELPFKNPIKLKFYRKSSLSKELKDNKFIAYLNGEIYDENKYIFKENEYVLVFANKMFKMYIHLLVPTRAYVCFNNDKNQKVYHKKDYLCLKSIYARANNLDLFFAPNVESKFTEHYDDFFEELSKHVAEEGRRFLNL